ncbi:DUF3099 domain-containing protein [Sinomonas sp. R1AF57]|uniref:DUF3099 domain-containing protein n=1 Tax=Sinomonas sp. R1AF57 TaxID=2020377 RepID=UPI000B5DEAAF|nr:DUF3099 domain-containing protein [Sinomonas sp. R1AF57]ASN51932.1 hypothetical protein CGQ25_07480 [Sinomonas sp. R1AF57]
MTKESEGRTGRAEGQPQGIDDAVVHSITTAAPGHSVDMHQRMVRYSLAMGIRMVCIIALFFLDGWFKLIAVAGAVFLPWVAVVIANAQTKAETFESDLYDSVPIAELGTGSWQPADPGSETIAGETVDEAPGDQAPGDADGEGGGGRSSAAGGAA